MITHIPIIVAERLPYAITHTYTERSNTYFILYDGESLGFIIQAGSGC